MCLQGSSCLAAATQASHASLFTARSPVVTAPGSQHWAGMERSLPFPGQSLPVLPLWRCCGYWDSWESSLRLRRSTRRCAHPCVGVISLVLSCLKPWLPPLCCTQPVLCAQILLLLPREPVTGTALGLLVPGRVVRMSYGAKHVDGPAGSLSQQLRLPNASGSVQGSSPISWSSPTEQRPWLSGPGLSLCQLALPSPTLL